MLGFLKQSQVTVPLFKTTSSFGGGATSGTTLRGFFTSPGT